MFECPHCHAQTPRLVECRDEKRVGCPNCHEMKKNGYDYTLHTIVAETNDGKHKVTKGKAWEIDHRRIAEDGKTVINHVTGKEAQY